MKVIWTFFDPFDEFCQPRMRLQRRDGRKTLREFGLGQRGVYLIMTNLMQKNRRPAFATTQLGYQMVQALLSVGRNGPVAEWANWQIGRQDWAPSCRKCRV